ncbi:exported hypothetical protein [Hyphomicrobium sp. GJ21]|nr:exported hypothetical protein [Hyphomicrobium sp. GJ21]
MQYGHHGANTSTKIGLPCACASSSAFASNGLVSNANEEVDQTNAKSEPKKKRERRILKFLQCLRGVYAVAMTIVTRTRNRAANNRSSVG